MDVGFVGLGGMGREMAANLVRAGHSVRVWNRSPGPVNALVAQGARPATDVADVFAADVVVSMLADDAAVESVLLVPELLANAAASVHVNMATVSVALATRAAEVHAEHGVGYVAAPVLGRTEVAAAGNLNIMTAGDPALLDRLEPLFEAMGRRTRRVGTEPHQANTAKISANYLIACAIEALSEACALAEAGGVAPADLIDVITGSILPGPVYSGYGAMVAERRYEPVGFRLVLGRKDVELALTAGIETNVPMAFGGALRDVFIDALAHGDGERDWAAVAESTRRRAGLD